MPIRCNWLMFKMSNRYLWLSLVLSAILNGINTISHGVPPIDMIQSEQLIYKIKWIGWQRVPAFCLPVPFSLAEAFQFNPSGGYTPKSKSCFLLPSTVVPTSYVQGICWVFQSMLDGNVVDTSSFLFPEIVRPLPPSVFSCLRFFFALIPSVCRGSIKSSCWDSLFGFPGGPPIADSSFLFLSIALEIAVSFNCTEGALPI